jgi:hypothetical protein
MLLKIINSSYQLKEYKEFFYKIESHTDIVMALAHVEDKLNSKLQVNLRGLRWSVEHLNKYKVTLKNEFNDILRGKEIVVELSSM